MCTCAVWISRHVQVHIHYSDNGQKETGGNDQTHNENAPDEVQVGANIAYGRINNVNATTRAVDRAGIAADQPVQFVKLDETRCKIRVGQTSDRQGHIITAVHSSRPMQGHQFERNETKLTTTDQPVIPRDYELALQKNHNAHNAEEPMYESISPHYY